MFSFQSTSVDFETEHYGAPPDWGYDRKTNDYLSYFCVQYPQALDWLKSVPLLQAVVVQGARGSSVGRKEQKILVDCLRRKIGVKQAMRELSLPWQLRHIKTLPMDSNKSMQNWEFSAFKMAEHPYSQMRNFDLNRQMDENENYTLCSQIRYGSTRFAGLHPDATLWTLRIGCRADRVRDYMLHRASQGQKWPMKWSWAQAMTATNIWHDQLDHKSVARYDDSVEILPDGLVGEFVYTGSGWRIEAKALVTRRALALEGKHMGNCVGQDGMNYWRKWQNKTGAFYHLQAQPFDGDGRPVGPEHGYTFEITKREYIKDWQCGQIEGRSGSSAPSNLMTILESARFMSVLHGRTAPHKAKQKESSDPPQKEPASCTAAKAPDAGVPGMSAGQDNMKADSNRARTSIEIE